MADASDELRKSLQSQVTNVCYEACELSGINSPGFFHSNLKAIFKGTVLRAQG